MKITVPHLLITFFSLTYLLGCECHKMDSHPDNDYLGVPPEPLYETDTLWYISEKNAPYDVFYIIPTCLWSWDNGNQKDIRFADVYRPGHRQRFIPNMQLADSIFACEANFYAPFYRQLTMENWIEGDSSIERNFPIAYADIEKAFAYYLKNMNPNRPFVLAGFSQGAKMVVELLKEMDSATYKRLIAAYAAGYRVTESESNQYPTRLKAAQDSTDLGVLICYNSASGPDRIPEILNHTVFCINPLNWSIGQDTATIISGTDSIKVSNDTLHHYLHVQGIDENFCYIPELAGIFPPGNFHLLELTLYRNALTQNVKTRAGRYGKR